MIERARIVLPEPDSPTMPSAAPRSSVEADAVDGTHQARAACEKWVFDVGDLEQRARVLRPEAGRPVSQRRPRGCRSGGPGGHR